MELGRSVQILFAGTALASLFGCASAEVELDSKPESITQVREIHHFESLAEIVATADLVVVAEVTKIRPGRWHGAAGADDSTRSRAVTLDVEEVKWPISEAAQRTRPKALVLEEDGWTSDGQGFQIDGLPWLSVGDRGVFAVDLDEKTGNAYLVNSQSRFLFEKKNVIPSGEVTGPLARQARSLEVSDLLAELDQAVGLVESGRVLPDAGLDDGGNR